MPRRNLGWLLMVPALVFLGLAVGFSAPPPDRDYLLIRQVANVLAEVDASFVRELKDDERQKLVEDMINGGLQRLDPYSEYLNAARLAQFDSDSKGAFGGVGISLGEDKATKFLKVDHPMPGTPAYEAGIAAGDLIVKVGDTSGEGLTVEDARKLIMGKPGTPVTFTTRRDGRTPPDQEVSLTRGEIAAHPVAGVRRNEADPTKWEWFADPAAKIGYVRVISFSELTVKELRAALEEIEAAGGRGVVIDLRENPGGLLNQAIDFVDTFISSGKIVTTRDRRDGSRVFSAKADDKDYVPAPGSPRPVAVLVNRASASASEIVAAALQDHGRGVVVGERSFGKGSVQKLLPLRDDPPSAIKLTTETYWRPSDRNIDRARAPKDRPDEWGVSPDPGFEVPTTDEERVKYLLHLRDADFTRGKPGLVPPAPAKPKEPDPKAEKKDDKPFEDRVLNRALDHIRNVLNGKTEAPRPAAVVPPLAGV